jgi:subtilisin family serine protease
MIVHLPPYRVDAVAYAAPSSGVDWHLSAYGIPSLWLNCQGEGVQVGVLDTGVEPGHPALEGRVLEHRNFTTDYTPYDTNGHGTHVAGILAAHGPLQGIAPQATILSCKVLGNDGAGPMRAVAEAVTYAVDKGCQLIVMSLGAPMGSGSLEMAIRYAYSSGVTVVCAAGNDGGRVSYPAAYGETVGVGAVDRDGRLCEFSCRGNEIDVAAPGWQIRSSWVNGGYATLSGTSMAAPFVAGVLALACSQRGGKMLGSTVKDILKETSADAGPPGKDSLYGWGLIGPSAILGLGERAVI